MDYQLVVTRGRSASTVVNLVDGVTTAGRQDECQLRIKSSQVSRQHCQFYEKNGMLLVKDLGSSNGTFLNGKKIDGQRVLEPGDEVTIGPIKFKVQKIGQPLLEKAPESSGPKPGDTGVMVAKAQVDDDEFEIEFDDDPVAPEEVEVDFEFDDEPAKPAAPAAKAPPAAAKPEPPKPAAAKPAPEVKPTEDFPALKENEVADDAIADFLMDIKIDDED